MSKIKLGDSVRFVNENMQGIVTSLQNNTAGVTIEDDFEIPVPINEIVRIEEVVSKPIVDKKPITEKSRFVKIYSGFHIAFHRINDKQLELILHNSESDWATIAVYYNQKLVHKVSIAIETNVSLGNFNMDEINQLPEMIFVITPLREEFKPIKLITKKIIFTEKEFHSALRQCYFLAKQAYCFRLDN